MAIIAILKKGIRKIKYKYQPMNHPLTIYLQLKLKLNFVYLGFSVDMFLDIFVDTLDPKKCPLQIVDLNRHVTRFVIGYAAVCSVQI